GGEGGTLAREEQLGVEDVLAGGAAGVELLLADAQVLLRLADRSAGGVERRETLRGRVLGVADGTLQLAELPLDGELVAVGLDAPLGDLRLAPAVRAEVPREADVARPDALRLEDVLAGPVGGAAGLEVWQPAAHEGGHRVLQPLLLLEQREQHGVVGERVA